MIRLNVPDMNCGHCKASVEAAISRAAPGTTIKVDLGNRRVEVEGEASAPALVAALAEVGFPASSS